MDAAPPTRHVMGADIAAITMDETVALICESMKARRRVRHCAINAAKLVKMRDDPELREDVRSSTLCNADGMAVVWAARLLGEALPERVTGIDLMDRLLARCASDGFRPFILGARQEILERAAAALAERHPGLRFAGLRNGYFKPEEMPGIVAEINASEADCLFVAMPTPHKERFLARNADALTAPYLMGVGGSIDVFAGHVRRAPEWMCRIGLEWLYRLLQEPRRMFRRYLVTNTKFILLVLGALARGGRAQGSPPSR